jgi:hypothetical protein
LLRTGFDFSAMPIYVAWRNDHLFAVKAAALFNE